MPGDKPVIEQVPKFRKNVVDVTLENKNNSTIWMGVDRPPSDEDYTQPAPLNDGEPGTATIDVVVGRESRDPNYDTDRARLLISSMTDGDTNFGLTTNGFLTDEQVTDVNDGNSFLAGKADSIRLIARDDVRIQNQNNGSSITMTSDGDVIIHSTGNVKIGSKNAEEALVLGAQFLDFATKVLDELSSLQDSLKKHKHPTSHGPSGPAFNLAEFAQIQQKFNQLKESPISDEAIISDFVFIQKESGNE